MVTRRNASCNANGQLMTNEGNFEELFSKNIKLKIYKTVILSVILYKEKRLQVFENKNF
ncbi:hypothetical protein C0J52_03541 [Blattella germanica]|nr:hypothetical protein C0J52_03541 [Blattella germanica]